MKTTVAKIAALMFGASLMMATTAYAEGKCGASKCGGDMGKKVEKKMDGKCGGDMKKKMEKKMDGKCGSSKCGGDKEKKMKTKCGAGKCGS